MYRFWIRQVKKITKNQDRILEVGCGLGYFLRYLAKDRNAIGIDISRDALQIARKFTDIPLMQTSAEEITFKKESFSMVIAMDLIEHLHHPEIFISESSRVLKKNGYLLITTPNLSSFGARVKGQKPELHGKPYSERMWEWHAWRDESHINIRSITEWRRLLWDNGFKILRDGTDTLWDVPYFKGIPYAIQKVPFISAHWILTWLFGFFPWKWGENYICIARKVGS